MGRLFASTHSIQTQVAKPNEADDSGVCNKPAIGKDDSDHGDSEEVKVLADQLCGEDEEEMAIAQEFVCQICLVHVVGNTPQLTSCSHLFCGDCIDKWSEVHPGNQSWARRAQSGNTVPCPACKEPLEKGRDLHEVSATAEGNGASLWQMLCGTKIMCANHSKCSSGGQCDWTGDYGSYQEHIRACQNKPLYGETLSIAATDPATTVVLPTESESCDCVKIGVAQEVSDEIKNASELSETTEEPCFANYFDYSESANSEQT